MTSQRVDMLRGDGPVRIDRVEGLSSTESDLGKLRRTLDEKAGHESDETEAEAGAGGELQQLQNEVNLEIERRLAALRESMSAEYDVRGIEKMAGELGYNGDPFALIERANNA